MAKATVAQKTIFDLSKAKAAALVLRETLKVTFGEDKELIHDTIEGETPLHECIGQVMEMIRDDEMLLIGVEAMLETLSLRKDRFKKRIDSYKAAIEQAMLIGEIPKLELADATLSLRAVPPKVEITDEPLIPAAFWKQPEPSLDKTALLASLKEYRDAKAAAEEAGAEPPDPIPGAELGAEGITLALRRA